MADIRHSPEKTHMLSQHLMQRGITDARVLKAMATVPREEFVLPHLREFAYQDNPLPIGFNQTVSQPYIVALICQLLQLKGNHKVLDIGTGSGYQAAVLSCLVRQVVTIERIPDLARLAKQNLKRLGYKNVSIIIADGAKGYSAQAPYDAVKSAAVSASIPEAWKKQLKEGGRIVTPFGADNRQELVRIIKKDGQYFQESWGEVSFVPLVTQL